MSLEKDLDRFLVKDSCQFNKALTPAQWYELTEWCDSMFGKKNWFLDHSVMNFNGHCPEGSTTLFLLRWS